MAAQSVRASGEASVRTIFENLDYGPAVDADNVAKVSFTLFVYISSRFCLFLCTVHGVTSCHTRLIN